MPSSSRNSRKPIRALGLAAAVSLLLGSAAQAADEPHQFVMTAYSNGRGGADLVAGRYEAALKEIGSGSGVLALDPAAVSNNRCVALAITKQWEPARAACDKAVRDAQQERANLATYLTGSRKIENGYVAVALSNRAVVNYLAADTVGAENDLKKAEILAPNASFVERNLLALHAAHTTVAQVSVTPQT